MGKGSNIILKTKKAIFVS